MTNLVKIWYNPDPDRQAIRIDVRPEAGRVLVMANKDGMALLAELVTDMLVDPDSDEYVYTVDEDYGLMPGSPKLVLDLDPGMD